MNTNIPHFGEMLAILTAVTWAIAVILFKKSGEKVHPLALNLFKDILAALLIVPTMFLWNQELYRDAPVTEYLLLLLSGAIGIALADTLFFISLNKLGAALSAVVDCLYSPFVIVLSMIWLGDRLSWLQWVGVALILSAVLNVSNPKGAVIDKRKLWSGIIFGVLAMLFNAVGIVMIKPLLDRSPLLWVTEVRLVGGAVALLLVILLHPLKKSIIGSIFTTQRWGYTLSSSFIGAYLAMVLWLGGMKFTNTSIAAALNQTSNIFIFLFAIVLLKEPVTKQRAIGIALGVIGAFIVTFG